MIPYRRQRAIESGAPILAADIAPGDIILVRRPGAVDQTAETVLSVDNIAGGILRIALDGFEIEPSRDIPIRVTIPTSGSWRQFINGR